MRTPIDLRDELLRSLNGVLRAAFVLGFLAFAFLASPTCGSRVYAAAGDDIIDQGVKYHESRNYTSSIAAFEDYIRRYPNGAQRNKAELFAGHGYMLRNKYTTLQDANSAQTHFDYILKQSRTAPYYKEAQFHTAHLAFDMENYQKARQLFNDFLNQYPSDGYVPYALYYLANCEAKLGNTQQAISYYEKALNQYPNSSLRWNCSLERATLIGKLGDYQTAERELAALANTNNLPPDVAGQVAVQRALLKIVQTQFREAIDILERFVSQYRNSNDPLAVEALRSAYLHEAYAYYAMREYDRALSLIEVNFERNASTLPPEVALLKIKLLLIVNRVPQAEDLFRSIANSTYGQNSPDVLTSYQGLVDLMKGNYDRAIDSLTRMLEVTYSGTSSSSYGPGGGYGNGYSGSNYNGSDYNNGYNNGYNNNSGTYGSNYGPAVTAQIGYFRHTGGRSLDPLDCVEATANLILAHASRYARTRRQQDYDYQEALFRELSNYSNWLKEPTVSLLVTGVDKYRKSALEKPVVAGGGSSYYIVTPYAYDGYSSTPGQFSDPTNYNNYSRPDYYSYGTTNQTYRPYDYYNNDSYRWGNQDNPNRYDRNYNSNDPNGYDTRPSYGPSNNGNGYPTNGSNGVNGNGYPTNGSNQSSANRPQNQQQGYPQNPNGQNPQQGNPQNPNGQNPQQGPNGQNQQQGNPQNPNGQNPQQGNPQNPNGQNPQQGNPQNPNGQNPQQGNPQNPNGQNPPQGNPPQGPNGQNPNQPGEEEVRLTPGDAQKALEKAEVYYHNGEFDRCNEILLETLTSSETFWQDCPGVAPKIALLRANALVFLHKRSEAQMSYQSVLDNAPSTAEATMSAAFIGFNFDSLGRTEDAVKYLRRATSNSAPTPFTDAALYYLGLNEQERGNIDNAKQAFERIYRDYHSSSYWSHAAWAYAQLLANERNDKEAEKVVNDALGSKPDTSIVDYLLFLKGEIALRAKDYTKALIAFDMIVDQYPDSDLYSRARNRLTAIPAEFRGEEEDDEEYEEEPMRTNAAPQTQRPAAPQQPRPTTQQRPAAPTRSGLDEFDVEAFRRAAQTSSDPYAQREELPKAKPLDIPGRRRTVDDEEEEVAPSRRTSGRGSSSTDSKSGTGTSGSSRKNAPLTEAAKKAGLWEKITRR